MVYTLHGHHIPGSKDVDEIPRDPARCGGILRCDVCHKEAQEYKYQNPLGNAVVESTNMDDVIKKYAKIAENIYHNRTAGDHTWTGFLAEFIMELDFKIVTETE